MLNSGKKIALCATKKINILTLVLSEIKFLNETKNHSPPPLKLNGRSLCNSTNRCNLIKDVTKNMTKKKILVNQQEIINAMQKLKNGKSADEYGIIAEHIKYAGKETIHIYQSIFNQIFDEGKVATTFKTGVI